MPTHIPARRLATLLAVGASAITVAITATPSAQALSPCRNPVPPAWCAHLPYGAAPNTDASATSEMPLFFRRANHISIAAHRSASVARAAESTRPSALAQLKSQLAALAALVVRHGTPSLTQVSLIHQLVTDVELTLHYFSATCRTALMAAEHLYYDLHDVQRMRGDIQRAQAGLPSCGQPPTPVEGTLVDVSGHPVPHATVTAGLAIGSGANSEALTAMTNSTGHFAFQKVWTFELRSSWHFLPEDATFTFDGEPVTLALVATPSSTKANLRFALAPDSNAIIRLSGSDQLCEAAATTFPLTVTLTPSGRLADGGLGQTRTISISQQNCGDAWVGHLGTASANAQGPVPAAGGFQSECGTSPRRTNLATR